MPSVWSKGRDKVIAVLCADIHLSSSPPRARREEPDWFKAMKKPLDDLAHLSTHYNAPILCAGDIFNHWKADPALINFALKYLPPMYAIPGQHDLPLHNIDLIEKSAFWTMVLSERVIPIIQKAPVSIENDIILHGFYWGKKLTPLKRIVKSKYHVALVHDFLWTKNHTYPNAPKTNKASQYRDRVEGYHAVVFGDNHKGFKIKLNNVPVWNCGTLMRRNSDEKEYVPKIGLLCQSGNIITHRTNTIGESLKTNEEDLSGLNRKAEGDMLDFLNGLKEAQIHNFDFVEAIEFLMKKYSVSQDVRKILLEVLDRG